VFEAIGVDQQTRELSCECEADARTGYSDIDFLRVLCVCKDSAEAERVRHQLCPKEWDAEAEGELVVASINVREHSLPISFVPAVESASGRLRLVLYEKPLLAQMPCLIAALYILGMLVRYCPDTWTRLSSERSEVFRLFEVFCGEVLPRLAQHTLNQLTGRLYYFAG
jgi:hypothetical protein